MLAEEFCDISSEDEIEDHDYLSSDDDGEVDATVPDLAISDEEVKDYQIYTEQTLATNGKPQLSFAWNNKTERWKYNPQSELGRQT